MDDGAQPRLAQRLATENDESSLALRPRTSLPVLAVHLDWALPCDDGVVRR